MNDLLVHYHKPHTDQPGSSSRPAECCLQAFEKQRAEDYREAERRREETGNGVRKKVILEGAAAIATYGDAAASVLPDAQAELVRKVTAEAVKALKKVGCICPYIDVSTLGQGEGTTFIQSRDGRCGMHEED